ncbi:hypothetical protein Unana1_03067 [Umbelopsis nana]
MSTTVKLAEFATSGILKEENFSIVTEEKPAAESLKLNQLLVRVTDVSADPHMRLYFSKSSYYNFPIGQAINGIGVGVVEASTSNNFRVGDAITNPTMDWANYAVVDANTSVKLDVSEFPIDTYLGVLGMTSFTAYLGLALAKPVAGETLLLSTAAGAVGQIVVQLAKELDLTVIAIAGSDDKLEYVKSLGVDACINYKTANDMSAAIQEAAPNGIDIYWDNVGGELLDIAITKLKKFGRVILCGGVSQYSADGGEVYGLKNTHTLITSSASMIGFLFSDYMDTHYHTDFIAKFRTLIKENKLQYKTDVLNGIDQAPRALIDLFESVNFGKRILHIADA